MYTVILGKNWNLKLQGKSAASQWMDICMILEHEMCKFKSAEKHSSVACGAVHTFYKAVL